MVPTKYSYILEVMAAGPASVEAVLINGEEDGHGCALCGIHLSYDAQSRQLSLELSVTHAQPEKVTAVVIDDENHLRYTASEEAVRAVTARCRVLWSLPPSAPPPMGLRVRFAFEQEGRKRFHECCVRSQTIPPPSAVVSRQ
jgi:hypothetical protein